MSTKRLNNRQKVGARILRARRIAALDRVNLASLGSKSPLSGGAKVLARRLIVASAGHRARMSDIDVLFGMISATCLCALSTGMTAGQFAAFLRRTAFVLLAGKRQ
jgi:hypothetical protein